MIFRFLLGLWVVSNAAAAVVAGEFNYDANQRYLPFADSKGLCSKSYKDIHVNLAASVSYSAPQARDVEVTCENMSEMRSLITREIAKIRPLAAPFADYSYASCVCDAYVAVRLSEEGYSTAKSDGKILDLKKTVMSFNEMKRVSANLKTQIDRLTAVEWKLRDAGRKLCAGQGSSACSAEVLAANCQGEKQNAYYKVESGYDFFHGPSNSVWHAAVKSQNGLASLMGTDSNQQSPYCQNNWGSPGTGAPRYNGNLTFDTAQPPVLPNLNEKPELLDEMPVAQERAVVAAADQPVKKKRRGLFSWLSGRSRDDDSKRETSRSSKSAR